MIPTISVATVPIVAPRYPQRGISTKFNVRLIRNITPETITTDRRWSSAIKVWLKTTVNMKPSSVQIKSSSDCPAGKKAEL